ncbi:MAG: TRAP transporter substrate-binding protein [Saprospiraceae bacterium]|nr:TRAP transporter substrate-binding protein [Saprospiraceae bacterium]
MHLVRKAAYLFLTCLIIQSLLVSCVSKQKPEILLRAALWANEDHSWYQAFLYFDSILHARTDGRLRVEVYPSEQLAKEMEAIRLIQAGIIDMTVSASLLSNWIEIATFCELPFLLQDSIEKHQLINGPIGQRIKREMLEKTGLRPVATFERGPRHLTSNRPIRHPDDLQGLIIRVPSVPSFVTAWSALGAKPTPMAFSEVFTSLQQGTIEAQENPFALILSAGLAEVQDYVNLTEHVMSWSYPLIGENQFQAIPSDLQEIFLEAAKDMEDYEHILFQGNELSARKELIDRGMEFIYADKEAFIKKCQQPIYFSLSPEMQQVYGDFIKSVRK